MGGNAHGGVDAEKPIGVHGANVVEHVVVGERGAQGQHEEVQAEQHLAHAPQGVVFLEPEEREVACARKWRGGDGSELMKRGLYKI